MKVRKILCLLLITLLLAACDGTQEPAVTTTAPTTAPTVATTVPTVPTEPEIVLEAVNFLNFQSSDGRPEVCVLDARTVAFLTVGHAPGDYNSKLTTVRIWDLYTDTLVTEGTLEGAYGLMAKDVCTGYLCLYDSMGDGVRILDRNLEDLISFTTEDPTGVVTQDLSAYYYLWGTSLYRMDLATMESQAVELDADMPLCQIQGFDPTENVLLVTVYTDPYTQNVSLGAVNLTEGKFTMLLGNVTGGQLAAGGVCLQKYDVEIMGSDASYLDWEDGLLRSLPDFMPNDGTYSTWHISGTDYICKVTFDAIQKDAVQDCQLYRLGESLAECPMMELLDGAKINGMTALPDGNLLALEVSRRGFTPFLICPEMLSFTDISTPEAAETPLVDQAILDAYQAELDAHVLGEEFTQVRQTADALEDEFDVTILISSQCTTACSVADLPLTTTAQAQIPNETEQIEKALKELRNVLEMYPADFFSQFRNEAGERGLLILLIEAVSSDRNTIGLCYQMGEWYPIAIDITSGHATSTYAHEIWHATENKITAEDSNLLSNAVWDVCNPSGYVYSYDTTAGYVNDIEYTFFYESKESDIYFVDSYGKTNPYEDRARIMEYIMTSESYAREIAAVDALRQKLKIMSDAIRAVFDTEDWGKVRWERFF